MFGLSASRLLQGSVAIAGAVVRWLRDNMGIVQSSSEIGVQHLRLMTQKQNAVVVLYKPNIFNLKHLLCLISETLAAAAGSSYGCYFVPAFSGLYAPYWEPSARG